MKNFILNLCCIVLCTLGAYSQDYMISEPHEIQGDDYWRITQNLTLDKVNRQLFSAQASAEWVRGKVVSGGQEIFGYSIAITVDPEWNRIVYSDYDEWIRSYGTNQGDETFSEPQGMNFPRKSGQ